MEKSTHRVEVIEVKLEKHPNADALSIVRPFGGYTVCVRTEEYKDGDLAFYVPPDSLVPLDTPTFRWLKDSGRTPKVVDGVEYHHVKVVKLRKVISQGLLVRLDEDELNLFSIGDDGAEYLGVIHYEPPVNKSNLSGGAGAHAAYGSAQEAKPSINPPGYDIDALKRYVNVFAPGEPVYISEKVHGANARYCAEDRGFFSWSARRGNYSVRFGSRVFGWNWKGLFYKKLDEYAGFMRCGSRNQWKRPDPSDDWWQALTPEMAKFCRAFPKYALYGEICGDIQDLDYGLQTGIRRFVAFDVFDSETRSYLDAKRFLTLMTRYQIQTVPLIALDAPFDLNRIVELAEGPSILHSKHLAEQDRLNEKAHVREGVVIKAMKERIDSQIGRACLKVVGNGYYDRV